MIGSRSQVAKPVQKRETVLVPSLGFEVIVRQMSLSEKLDLSRKQVNETLTSSDLVEMVSKTVLADDLRPVFTFDEWEIFGSDHSADFNTLLRKVFDLSGLGISEVEQAKKSEEGLSINSLDPSPDS